MIFKKTLIIFLLCLAFLLPNFAAFAAGTGSIDGLTATTVLKDNKTAVALRWNAHLTTDAVVTVQKWDATSLLYLDIGSVSGISEGIGEYIDPDIVPGNTYYYQVVFDKNKLKTDIAPTDLSPTPDPTTGGGTTPTTGGGTTPTTGGGTTPTKDEGGMFERAIASVFDALVGVVEKLEKSQGLKNMDTMLFNKGMPVDQKMLLPFTTDEWNKLNKWYIGLSGAVSCLVLIAVMVTSFKLMSSGKNPQLRSDAKESAWRWILAILFVASAPLFVKVIFYLNNAMVDTIWSVAQGVITGTVDSKLSLSNGTLKTLHTGSVLGTAIVKLAYAGIELYLNFVFLLRKCALIVIFVFTPVMVWMWAINKNVNAATIWLGEVISNAFMQTAYALVFLVFLTFAASSNWIEALIWAMAVIPLGEMIRNSVQGLFARMSGFDEAGTAGKVMGAIGLGSILGAGRLAGASAGTGSGRGGTPGVNSSESGSTMNLQGSEAPSSMPPLSGAGTGPSAGAGIGNPSSGSLPSGFSPTSSGLIVPSSVAQGTGAAGQSLQGAGTAEQSLQGVGAALQPGAGLAVARQMGNKVGSIASKATGIMAGVALAPVPGGEKLVGGITKVAGAAGDFAGTAVGLGMQTKKVMDQTGQGAVDSLKNVVGANTIKLNGTQSLDGYGIRRS